MAAFDISRVAFEPQKHFTSARMQQGRVLTDDDWNENERIHNENTRRSLIDIIGAFGSPDDGFRIESNPNGDVVLNSDGTFDFDIHNGTLYLGGLRLEMDMPEKYLLQSDWLTQSKDKRALPKPSPYSLVYLEAWQQAICAVEDKSLFEVALGGPDTTTRIRNMRQVKLATATSPDCMDAWQELVKKWKDDLLGAVNTEHERERNTKLTVYFVNTKLPEDLCTPSVLGGYLGAENQAIRVQLTGKDTFTWGFDNAAPLYRVKATNSIVNGVTVTEIKMATLPKDQYHYPLSGQVVEILPWSAVLSNRQKVAAQSGQLRKVADSYDPDTQTFTLSNQLPTGFGEEWKLRSDNADLSKPEDPPVIIPAPTKDEFFYMRVWNRGTDMSSDTEIAITAAPIPLGNTGLQIKFEGSDRVKEDYWVIAARPETPNKIVPWALESGMLPFGVRRFFAPLAVIQWTLDANQRISGKIIHDCRKKFNPLTDLECCCTYTVGEGRHSKGDFNSIQEAIDNLPSEGGKICVLPGIHTANVSIINRRQIQITGCGNQSIVRASIENEVNLPIFYIESSQKIRIDNLTLVTFDGTAVEVRDRRSANTASQEIEIDHNSIIAGIHAINIRLQEDVGGANNIYIHHNTIALLDKKEALAAIFTIADDVLIERNRLVIVPAPDPADPSDNRDPQGPTGVIFDPCFNRLKFYENRPLFRDLTTHIFAFVKIYLPFSNSKLYQAQGGIQIGGTSERVRVIQNEIIGGYGNGITLGHLPEILPITEADKLRLNKSSYEASFESYPSFENLMSVVQRDFLSTLYEIAIEENHIQQMGLNGVGIVLFMSIENIKLMVRVEDLTIYRNKIMGCALQTPTDIDDKMRDQTGYGGIVLATVENAVIQENSIENNGNSQRQPICGIFILHGEKIDVSNNRILNNGPRSSPDNDNSRGTRGGIVIKMAFQAAELSRLLVSDTPSFDGIPAVKAHDNIVNQPLGHALLLMAMGPVSVVGNQFTTQGIDRLNTFSILAGSVFIMNLGVSKDLLVFNFKLLAKNPESAAKQLQTPQGMQMFRALQLMPSGRTLFSNNQTTLDMRSSDNTVGFSSQLIVSLDDVAFNSNQTECAAFLSLSRNDVVSNVGAGAVPSFDFVLFNTVLLGSTVRSNDNRFTEGFTFTLYSLLSLAMMNTAIGNQASHCLHVLGYAFISNDNLILDTLLGLKNCNQDLAALRAALGVKN